MLKRKRPLLSKETAKWEAVDCGKEDFLLKKQFFDENEADNELHHSFDSDNPVKVFEKFMDDEVFSLI